MRIVRYKKFEDLKRAVLETDYKLSKEIIEGVKENKDKKEKYLLMSLYAEDANSYIDIKLDPSDIEHCLLSNLKIMEREEDYDGCLDILELKKHFGIN